MAHDITEPIRTENELRQSEEKLRAYLESASQAIVTVDGSGRIEMVNARTEEMFGYRRDELIGQQLEVLLPERYQSTHVHHREQYFTGPRVRPMGLGMDLSGRHKDGAEFPVEIGLSYVRTTQGVLAIGLITDITERKRAEEERANLLVLEQTARAYAEAAQQRFSDLVQSVDAIVWEADAVTWRFTFVSQRAEAILGYPVERWLTEPDFRVNLIHPDDRERSIMHCRSCTDQGLDREFEYRAIAADGRIVWLSDIVRVVKDEAGRVQQLRGIMVDITQRKRAEEERAQLLAREQAMRAEAENASRLKDEFLATISHELRTPLTAVLGWSRMLRSGKLDAETREQAIEVIERNAKAQAQLIDDILDVSRIITGKLRLEAQPLEIAEVIDAAIDTVRPAAQARGIHLEMRLDPHSGAVLGDAKRLQQVIWNLLSNAVKFTPEGGRVDVMLRRIDSHVEIAVRDTGQGIRPEFLPYVFDRFRQADSSSTRSHGGLGLGLSIVRHLVELHGGTVRADSAGPGQGATFTVRLPLLPASRAAFVAAERADMALAAHSARLRGLHVLVVEDDADTRAWLCSVLKQYGAKVTAAASSADALERFNDARPDVLISDIGMPGEDGYALLSKVRAMEAERDYQSTPAIALTAYARAEDRRHALAAGYQIHLPKPVEPAELAAIVASLAPQRHS